MLVLVVVLCKLAMGSAYASDDAILMPGSEGSVNGPQSLSSVEDWFENLGELKQVKTKLHFYFQDVLSGENPTVWNVAEAQVTASSPTSFGQIKMVDDLLTSGPEADSTFIGRAQGTIGNADLHDTAIQMGLNIVFTEGKYNGSTISILGRNAIFHKDRELPIVGGTGVFRMARGIAVSNTHSYDVEASYGVLEYTLYIVHYGL